MRALVERLLSTDEGTLASAVPVVPAPMGMLSLFALSRIHDSDADDDGADGAGRDGAPVMKRTRKIRKRRMR